MRSPGRANRGIFLSAASTGKAKGFWRLANEDFTLECERPGEGRETVER